MKLFGRELGYALPPLYIAELSQNFSNISEAISLMSACKKAGAHAIKVQALIPDELTINHDSEDFRCKEGLWKGKKLYDLYSNNCAILGSLFEFGAEMDLPVFASVFGMGSLAAMQALNCPAYKISSFENNWPELIQACRDTGKPLLISSGLYPVNHHGFPKADVIMHCVSAYPTRLTDALLDKIPYYLNMTPYVGFSDHTIGTKAAEYAVALGARVIEKHVSLSHNTVDGAFSATPEGFRCMVQNCNEAWKAVTNINENAEADYAQYKRSIYVVSFIKSGECFNSSNVRVIRPSYGMNPARYKDVLGKVCKVNLSRGDALKEEYVQW